MSPEGFPSYQSVVVLKSINLPVPFVMKRIESLQVKPKQVETIG
jgi:hypothetical protein